MAPGHAADIMAKMGLGYDVLRAIKPGIIMIALSGYGATGPEKSYVSYGPPQVALSVHAVEGSDLHHHRGRDPGNGLGPPLGGGAREWEKQPQMQPPKASSAPLPGSR